MDAFEQLVCEILWMEGFWVQSSFKVDLTKGEKRRIGRHSSPRWELDIVAYKAKSNTLYVVECKSYLDSTGVTAAAFTDKRSDAASRYKLFNEPILRRVVLSRLAKQLIELGACRRNPQIQLALACGKIRNEADRKELRTYFDKKGWELWDESWLKSHISDMAGQSYENQMSSVVAKLMLRN